MNLLQKCPAVILHCPAAILIWPAAIFTYSNFIYVTIHQRRPVEIGGGRPKWTTSGGGFGHQPESPEKTCFWPQKTFFGLSIVCIGKIYCDIYTKYIAIYFVFLTFLRSIRSGRPRLGGRGVCQTDDVGQGGVQKVFARTSLMDEPLELSEKSFKAVAAGILLLWICHVMYFRAKSFHPQMRIFQVVPSNIT